MAKKKRVAKKKPASKPNLAVVDTAELYGDGDNPRKIDEEAAKGLANSLDRFGDLSGLVFNQRTGELVCGHQRMTQIREKWGDREIESLDATAELGCIRIDPKHTFPVRIVNWSPALQRAANVAANNQKIAGKFTDDLSEYLLIVQADLQEESPGLMNDLLLVDLLDIDLEEESKNSGLPLGFRVSVNCEDQSQVEAVQKLLTSHGYQSRSASC